MIIILVDNIWIFLLYTHTHTFFFHFFTKIRLWDFSGGSVVKNPPCNVGDAFDPGWGTKIPQAMGELSLTP